MTLDQELLLALRERNEARAEVERLRAHIAGEPDRTAHSMQRWMDIVKEQQAALRTVAERQRAAMLAAINNDSYANYDGEEVWNILNAVPLVTEEKP